jgi:hypothetical protein
MISMTVTLKNIIIILSFIKIKVEDERIDESGVNIGPGGIERKPHYHEHYDSKHDVENTDGMRMHKTIGENYNDHLKSC